MTQKELLAGIAALMAKSPSATVAIPGFEPSAVAKVRTAFAQKGTEVTANIVESTPFRRVRYSGRPSKAQIADLKAMGAFAHRVVGADGSQTWYWLVPTASTN